MISPQAAPPDMREYGLVTPIMLIHVSQAPLNLNVRTPSLTGGFLVRIFSCDVGAAAGAALLRHILRDLDMAAGANAA